MMSFSQANGTKVHKEWKPRKKPDQFGIPKQPSLLVDQPESNALSVYNSSAAQQSSRFLPQPQQQQQQHGGNTCAVCNQWFQSEVALKTHSITHTMDSDQMFIGLNSQCRQDYNQLSTVQMGSLSTGLSNSVEVCTICNMLMAEPGSLQLHLQTVHGQYS